MERERLGREKERAEREERERGRERRQHCTWVTAHCTHTHTHACMHTHNACIHSYMDAPSSHLSVEHKCTCIHTYTYDEWMKPTTPEWAQATCSCRSNQIFCDALIQQNPRCKTGIGMGVSHDVSATMVVGKKV